MLKNEKAIFLKNVNTLLALSGKSRNWFNGKLYGLTRKKRARGDLWRPDQKELALSVAKKAAKLLNKSVDDLLVPDKFIEYEPEGPIILSIGDEKKAEQYGQPPTDMLLSKAREILESGMNYATSLAANIESFYEAMKTRHKLADHDKRLATLESICKTNHPEESEKRGIM